MTDKHPLHPKLIDALSEYRTCDEAMRTAADWQMKQAINRFNDYHLKTFGWSPAIIELERLLRPVTTQEDN